MVRVFCTLLLTACFSLGARGAEVENSFDVSFKSGLAVGTVSRQTQSSASVATKQKETFVMGGIPLAMSLNRDLNANLTLMGQGQLLLDVPNQQLIRQGIEGGATYHLLGGVRRLVRGQGSPITIVSSTSTNFSLATRFGIFHYAATDRENLDSKLIGSVFETKGGFEYRREIRDEDAMSIELLFTIFTLPASVERIEPRTLELLFGYRTYL